MPGSDLAACLEGRDDWALWPHPLRIDLSESTGSRWRSWPCLSWEMAPNMSTGSRTLFDGQRVAIFEARMAGALADLVARQGGIPVAAPALREIPIENNLGARSFVDGLLAGQFDVLIFETGVGVRLLVQSQGSRLSGSAWADALGNTKVVARGPKPAAALRELGARIDFQVPEPNTWRETLALLDERLPVAGKRVAVQEYGKPVPELTDGLERRGAVVTRVPIYRWALPEDTGPLVAALTAIAERQIGVALFTAGQQVEHILQVAAGAGIERQLRAAFSEHLVVGSIGPSTSAVLRAHGLPVDIEPEHPKSGHLVAAVAASWRIARKAGLR
jgi:uroporphyrinogen-III synthase